MIKLVKYFVLLFCLVGLACQKKENQLAYNVSSDTISNQFVTDIVEDKYGFIWIATSRGLNRYNGYEYTQYYFQQDSVSLHANTVNKLLYDSKDRLWVGSSTHGIAVFEEGRFTKIPSESSSNFICQILEDQKGRILVNSSNDICIYDSTQNKLISKVNFFSKFPNPTVLNLSAIDLHNRLWVISQKDIKVYDENFSVLKTIEISPIKLLYSVYMNPYGDLWISHSEGLTVVDTEEMQLKEKPAVFTPNMAIASMHTYSPKSILIKTLENTFYLYDFTTGQLSSQELPFKVPNFETTTIFKDSKDNLWFGSTDKGLELVKKSEKIFNENHVLESTLLGKSVIKAVQSSKGDILFLTSADGLFKFQPETGKLQSVKLPFARFADKGNLYFSNDGKLWVLSGNHVFQCELSDASIQIIQSFQFAESMSSITEDYNGGIWVAGFGEYIYYKRKNESQFQKKQFYQEGYNNTVHLLTLKNGDILVSSFLKDLFTIQPQTLKTTSLKVQNQVEISPFIPLGALEDRKGNIWYFAHQNGLFKYEPSTQKLHNYIHSEIICNDISGLIEDKQGNIWVATQNGLAKIDPISGKKSYYFKESGTGGNQFNYNALVQDQRGHLYFGGTHGITEVDPLKPVPLPEPRLWVEKITLDQDKLYDISQDQKGSIGLNLNLYNNAFSVHYAFLNFNQWANYTYSYQLEGHHNQWIDAGKNRQANFYKVPPGKYVFRVKATSTNHEYSFETQLPIRIYPPWWASWPMQIVYLLLLIAGLLTAFNLFRGWKKNKEQAQLAEKEKQDALKINELNFNYFTNISHEFRSPLTMIKGPVSLLADKNLDSDSKTLVNIIQRNVNKMLDLVNQFLDFNQIKDTEIEVKVIYTDILMEIRRILDLFSFSAKEKNIEIRFTPAQEHFYLYLDRNKLDKILSNVLSNALKYTPPGGFVEVSLDEIMNSKSLSDQFPNLTGGIQRFVRINVKDNGIGIAKEDLKKVFERFYQVKDANGAYNYGSGIGLNYSQKLAIAHKGDMAAFQNTDQGTTLSLVLPLDEQVYHSTEIIEAQAVETDIQNSTQAPVNTKKKENILIVDDEPEVTYFLKTILGGEYNVECVFNAEAAIHSITTFEPDLIISDVLMPGMSGYEFCQYIKENVDYSHIPVILLTANSTTQEQVKGLYQGADAYVIKPFDPHYLLAVINSQINNRKKVREMLGNTTATKKMLTEDHISPYDKELLKEFYALMNEELDNAELNITKITERLKISRTKFYYKIKSLTGENPAAFFKTYKLNKAAELLMSGQYNISEIAYMTGYSTLSHFSLSFKKKFGVSPSEYKGAPKEIDL